MFMRERKLKVSVTFIPQSYFSVPENIRLNAKHYFIMKIPKKRELHQTALNQSSDIEFKDFVNLYKEHTKEPFFVLVNNAALP